MRRCRKWFPGLPGLRAAGILAVLAFFPLPLCPQTPAEFRMILERLERLEKENEALRHEVQALRTEIEGRRAPPAVEEQLTIHERRIAELAQTKVESSERFPIRVTGMALFNAFHNSKFAGGADNPLQASAQKGEALGGATFRQSVIGLEFTGPSTVWGGKVRGDLNLDLFSGSSRALSQSPRLRTASLGIDWSGTGVLFALDKPLFAPRDPNSLAQVGFSPLSRAGNLWLWLPQVRVEHGLRLGDRAALRAQVALIQTSERVPRAYDGGDAALDDHRRPGLEGRFAFSQRIDDSRRVDVAPGFHLSNSRVLGHSVPSEIFSLDWFMNPWWRRLEFTGAFFSGQNVAPFGAPNSGFTVFPGGRVVPVRSRGGWGQARFLATDRLSFNLFSGQHDDRDTDLPAGGVGKNLALAGNLMYRFAPNVILSFETMQVRTTYLGLGRRTNNHYDLAVAYLF
jgi:hypothetical protein